MSETALQRPDVYGVVVRKMSVVPEQLHSSSAVKSSCGALEHQCSISARCQSAFLVQAVANPAAAVNSKSSLAPVGMGKCTGCPGRVQRAAELPF